jgi:hypothetical protein
MMNQKKENIKLKFQIKISNSIKNCLKRLKISKCKSVDIIKKKFKQENINDNENFLL